ncbi:hypothetical protein KXX68_009438, partial [Aspergillus fumigatus]
RHPGAAAGAAGRANRGGHHRRMPAVAGPLLYLYAAGPGRGAPRSVRVPGPRQSGSAAVDAPGAAADPVRPIQRVFPVWDAADGMSGVGGPHTVRVPRDFDPHGGSDGVRSAGQAHPAAVAGPVSGGRGGYGGIRRSHQVFRADRTVRT